MLERRFGNIDVSELATKDRSERFTVTERVCLTRDGRVVREDELTDGGTLLFPVGMEIPLAEAKRYGLVKEIAAAAPVAETTPTPAAKPTPRKK